MTRLQRIRQEKKPVPLLGAAVYFNDPIFIEMYSHRGFSVMCVEMEHSHITFAEAANLCRISQGCGLLTMIRIPNSGRKNVLKAAACAPDIIKLPMANSARNLNELTKYARFAPKAERGFFSVSRAVKYGIVPDVPAEQRKLNDELCLTAQIESAEALKNVEEILPCARRGYLHWALGSRGKSGGAGADWSRASAGNRRVGDSGREETREAPGCQFDADGLQVLGKAGVDVLFCTNDTACVRIWSPNCVAAGARSSVVDYSGSPLRNNNNAHSRYLKFGQYRLMLRGGVERECRL